MHDAPPTADIGSPATVPWRHLPAASALLAMLLVGCQSLPDAPPEPLAVEPVRFLLTFDDGPSTRQDFNPTLAIHATLADNAVQPGIKALFFVQTRNKRGGGTEAGRAILRRAHEAGHVLGLHSGTARGHVRHTKMAPEELEQSLIDGMDDLRAITNSEPAFVRPPYWGHSEATRRLYEGNGLRMLLTDVNSKDGIVYAFNRRADMREHLHEELLRVRGALMRGKLPAHDGVTPVVVTFHDVNVDTARHIHDYLRILIEEARELGLPLAAKPFYDRAEDIVEAATQRAVPPPPTSIATIPVAAAPAEKPRR